MSLTSNGKTTFSPVLLCFEIKIYGKIQLAFPVRKGEGEIVMTDKSLIDSTTFIDNVNKKNKKHNGKKIRFAFVKRKRK